jgi:hypothetical protein
MNILAIAAISLVQATAANSELRIGVAAADARQHCLALGGAALEAGAPVTLITLSKPQRVFRAAVVRQVTECSSLVHQNAPGPYYLLRADASQDLAPQLAIAVAGRPLARSVDGEIRIDLSNRIRQARIRSCSSSEGLHLTVWSGVPLRSTRLWHTYWYLGYDVEPDCRPADIRHD